jgi:hypothetical protein
MQNALLITAALALGACSPALDGLQGHGAASAKSSTAPSWMGVYGDYERHADGNPGTFTVLMNADYLGLQADVVYREDGGDWEREAMTWVGHVDGNSLWQIEPSDSFTTGSTVQYFFHGYDAWGHQVWDSDDGANYDFPVASDDPSVLVASSALPAGTDLNQDLQVIFTPDEPALELELEMIDQVRIARLADAASYAEGANPYTVRYAAYNLTHDDIADALVAAHDDGVDVQVMVEADKIDASDLADAYQILVDGGFELVDDHDELDSTTTVTADLIGIHDYGLMHMKARIFDTPDWSALLTGSHNPQHSAMENDETLHLIRDEAIIAEYVSAYDALLAGDGFENSYDDSAAINVLFTPAADGVRASTKIFEWLEEEDEQILLMVFALRDLTAEGYSESLVELLGAKVAEGVPVYVITDRKMADGINADGSYWFGDDDTEDDLRDAGVVVFEVLNLASDYTAMHTKAAVLGRSDIRVITDASNWSYSGLGSSGSTSSNVESVLFIDSEALDDGLTGRRYLAEWFRILERYEDQDHGAGVTPEEVFATLSALSGWPTMDVDFAASNAYTGWGEIISVRGSASELGAWGPGLELGTDADSYPDWATDTPLAMPVGACFRWKLTAGVPGAADVSWESRDDRHSCVTSQPLVATEDQTISGSWGS